MSGEKTGEWADNVISAHELGTKAGEGKLTPEEIDKAKKVMEDGKEVFIEAARESQQKQMVEEGLIPTDKD